MTFPNLKTNIAVTLAALAIIITSVVVTLYFSGKLDVEAWLYGAPTGYRNTTFTDAVLTCQQETRDKFGVDLRHMVVDDHSSRFDQSAFRYKIFILAETATVGASGKLSMNYVNCFVRPSNGRIAKYETWEDKGSKASPVTDGKTNVFGFPRKK